MVDALEDLEDVQQVYHNVDLGEYTIEAPFHLTDRGFL